MKRFVLIIISLFLALNLYSHPWKPSHYVIVDTDGGIDDIKAITMLLASPDVRVLAITVSPGALSAENAYIKVRSLLNSFYHEGIPVGLNRNSGFKSPDSPVALQTIWGEEKNMDIKSAPDCFSLIIDILSFEKTKISFLCLGGMTTAYAATKNIPLFKQQVKEILWSADGITDTKGFNYNIDKSAATKILNGDIPVKIIKSPDIENFYNDGFLKELSKINTVYGEKILGFLSSDIAKSHSFSFSATDEMAALYLQFPQTFKTDTIGNNIECSLSEISHLNINALKMLKGETVAKNQVIKDFPVDPSFYFDDIKPFVNEIINKYGVDEWTSGVLANELHRHLGVFAIIGVKMGIRAREYFDTGVDEFSVTSFAGSIPPLSCMNDGIQVSTGATPGHGLLYIRNDTNFSASFEFKYMNRKIRLTLKPEIAQKISSELKEINFVYGLDSNIYWELVRKNTIKYWRDMDRHEIFVIEEISYPPSPLKGG
jgi:pyrimidine-specific ribonucleoside hydrolase